MSQFLHGAKDMTIDSFLAFFFPVAFFRSLFGSVGNGSMRLVNVYRNINGSHQGYI